MEKATFAAGCFWHVEEVFSKTNGVKSTAVGYTGGHTDNPTYEDVCTDKTGHAEAIQIEFDPTEISYSDLVKVFFENHNPTTPNRQGPDIGIQYRSAIFYHNTEQEQAAKEVKEKLNPFAQKTFGSDIVTEIKLTSTFYRAEEYHQKYFQKNS
jgi:peptide-methionine (S)-S-oxide reductase